MSDWRGRLRDSVQLTSPDGNIFNPLWRKDSYSGNKKLGIFEYPKVDGTIIQDLGINGTRYPLTLYFEGPDHDIEARLRILHKFRLMAQLILILVEKQLLL